MKKEESKLMSEMQVSVEDLGQLQRLLRINVPNYSLEHDIQRRLYEIRKNFRSDGFRPGKAPLSYLKKLYAEEVKHEVLNKAIEETLVKSLTEQGLEAACPPKITEVETASEVGLKYVATFEVYPSVDDAKLIDISLEKPKVEITETDVDQVLERLRHQHADWVEVQRPAQIGDQVIFDLLPPEGEARKDLAVVLRKEGLPEGFDKLIGCNVEESISVPLPKQADSNDSAELHAATLTIKKITEPKLPEINEEFAQRLGIKDGGVDSLRSQLRQHMQEGLENTIREKLKAQAIEKLLEVYLFDALPQGLIEEEFKRLEAEQQAKQSKENASETLAEKVNEELQAMAKKRVTLGLVFRSLIGKYQLQVDETRFRHKLNQFAGSFELDDAMRQRLLQDKNLLLTIRSSVLEDQVIDALLKEVTYSEKPMKYSEIMNVAFDQEEKSMDGTEL